MFPNYTLRERVADGCIHAIGITASLVALTVLLIIGVQSQMTLWVVSLAIYGAALVAMFSFSASHTTNTAESASWGRAETLSIKNSLITSIGSSTGVFLPLPLRVN